MKKALLLILTCTFIACSDDTPDRFENQLSGHYVITDIELSTERPIDLNNDGEKSTDIYHEIGSPHYLPNGDTITYHWFGSFQNLMEVRPLPETTNDAKLIAVNFPNQLIGELGNGKYYLIEYGRSFIHYTYELQFNMDIKLTATPFEGDRGTLHNLAFISDGRLELTLTKQLFDFKDQKWVDAELTVRYERVEIR